MNQSIFFYVQLLKILLLIHNSNFNFFKMLHVVFINIEIMAAFNRKNGFATVRFFNM